MFPFHIHARLIPRTYNKVSRVQKNYYRTKTLFSQLRSQFDNTFFGQGKLYYTRLKKTGVGLIGAYSESILSRERE